MVKILRPAVFAVGLTYLARAAEVVITDESALMDDGECDASEEQCSLSALQRRAGKLLDPDAEPEAASAGEAVAAAAAAAWSQCGGDGWTGATACAAGYECYAKDDFYAQCVPRGTSKKKEVAEAAGKAVDPPPPEAADAGEDEETKLHAHASGPKCASLDAPENAECKSVVQWAAAGGGKYDNQAPEWFKDMPAIAGVEFKQGNIDDFQRLYYCSPPGGKACGTPPCSCSHPPCDRCLANQKNPADRSVCAGGSDSIACKPPKTAMDYKGMAWPTITSASKEMHFFSVGDWGGMDGSLNPIEGRPPVVAYAWGARPGASVFPRTRWDLNHDVELCTHKQFLACFTSRGTGQDCPATCGYVAGVDDQPQQLVAKAMQARAADSDPAVILNVGDNFYWGGIEKTCGTPMDQMSFTAMHQFNQVFEPYYHGPGLDGKPWLSVLGNHDWGGRVFNNGWDQQIAYTWASDRWVMPAPYFMTTVANSETDFTVDIFMVDSNFVDAKEPSEDPNHNLCGEKFNKPNADCSPFGGPASIETCPQFFADLWQEQKVWLMKSLKASKADWQIMVTHFPCGEDGENQAFYRKLHQNYGLDLLVTGHRHDQELWTADMTYKNFMGGLTCFITGGGGGITSEATPDPENTTNWYGEGQYGFYDLTVTKETIKIESINWDGNVTMTHTIQPTN